MTTSVLYLDVCTLCRPFDDQNQPRIRHETESYYRILQSIQDGRYTLRFSPVHLAEIAAIGDPLERHEVKTILLKQAVPCDGESLLIRQRAEQLSAQGMGIADAAHIAFAEANTAIFITCDDRLIKQCRRLEVIIPTLTPVIFCEQENLI